MRRESQASRRRKAVDLLDAFLGLQRADREDQHAARRDHRRGCIEHLAGSLRAQRSRPAALLIQGSSGWRRIVPVAVQGASSRTNGAGVTGRKSRTSLSTTVAVQLHPREIFAQTRAARTGSRSTAVTSAPRRHKLHRLAARRGAKIDHGLAAHIAQQTRGQTSAAASCTHHPPSAKPGRSSMRAVVAQPDRRRRTGAHLPVQRALLQDICRAGAGCRCAPRNRARRVLAIGVAPARPQPVRRVERGGILRLDDRSWPSRDTRRSTALISGLKCTALLSACARRLAPSTAACGATFRNRSSHAPGSRDLRAPVLPCAAAAVWARSRGSARRAGRNAAASRSRWRARSRHRAAADAVQLIGRAVQRPPLAQHVGQDRERSGAGGKTASLTPRGRCAWSSRPTPPWRAAARCVLLSKDGWRNSPAIARHAAD